MGTQNRCQSCTMPVEAGPLCEHCSDEDGNLLPFAETFERFIQWTRRQDDELTAGQARRKTLEFMAGMPAWAGHPELAARLRADS